MKQVLRNLGRIPKSAKRFADKMRVTSKRWSASYSNGSTIMFFRSIALLIVGIGAFVQGFLRLGKPAQAVEKSGWLYQSFGDQGLAYGLMALGIVAFIPGVIWFNQSWIRAIRMRFKRN